MIDVTLKDGSKIQVEKGTSVIEVAKMISHGLARNAVLAEVDGVVTELGTALDKDCTLNILTFDSEEGKKAYRHTTSHILAQAVMRLYKDVRLAIGPATENGFYYDFDIDGTFTSEDLVKIEEEMKKIVSEKLPIERFVLPRDKAIEYMNELGETYKVELINDLPEDAEISFYRQGEFVDLCSGPHLDNTGRVKAFKLIQTAGAYWRGDEKNKMLKRIYGTSFPDKKLLKEYLEKLEEARKRDHNRLGRELELFTTVDYIGQGLPIMLPKGAKILQILQRFVEDEEEKRGYQITKTPFMAKSDLYKISQHWYHYRDGMFIIGDPEKADEEEVLALRPMTCPFQFQAYLTKTRSYRDLPIRYAETSTLFRNESSGEMHGLIRVRQFTISEGHLIVTPSQLEEEFRDCLDLATFMLKTLGLHEDVFFRFSKWDPENKEKYIGSPEEWENVQSAMKTILDNSGLEYTEGVGEAAFYGPKFDIQIRNVHGKEDTLITIQIDFQLAERFGMVYVDRDGTKKHPYIIHRTSIGCYERTLALLIEKYAGAFPTWLAPVQVRVMPIVEKQADYCAEVVRKLKALGVRAELDDRNEKIGYRIREAQVEKIPYMLVAGDRELEEGKVSVRSRKQGEMGSIAVDEFCRMIKEEIDEKRI